MFATPALFEAVTDNRRECMNIAFAFKNFEPSSHLKGYARRRFEKLGRFLPKAENVEASVMMSVDKFRHKIEVQMSGDNLNITAVEHSEDMYATVDMVLDKLEVQVKKHSEKLKEKRRSSKGTALDMFSYSTVGEGRERQIVGTDSFAPKPLHIDEAALQLEQHPDDEFLVFINAETGRVNVLYRRRNGDFGLIDSGL